MVSLGVNKLNLELFDLSAERKRCTLLELHRRLQPISLLVADHLGRVVFGHSWIRESHEERVEIQQLDLSEAEAWLLNFTLLNSFGLAELFEQLNVWRHLSSLMTRQELRKKIRLPFPLDDEIQPLLPALFSGALRRNLEEDDIVWQVLFRILKREQAEWPSWSRLFSQARFSRSRQIALMDALEEVLFRDKVPIADLVDHLSPIGDIAADRAEEIWGRLFRLRYPQTADLEDRWAAQVKDLGLPAGFSLKHAPFFESRQVDLAARFADFAAFAQFWKNRS